MINDKKICAIVQARQGSSRLPGKALIDICGKPALQRVIERLREAKLLDDVIVATTENEANNAIIELCEQLNCSYFRGSENDVLDRVLNAARKFEVDIIVEITADCLFCDWDIVDSLIKHYTGTDVDYCSNVIERTFPRGFDCQVFGIKTLERVNKEVDNDLDRQHVSSWIYLNPKSKGKYTIASITAPPELNRPDLEITLDTPEDLDLIRWLFEYGKEYRIDMTCLDVINAIDTYPYVYNKVKDIARKDYFSELKEAYESQGGAKDEKVECSSDRSRRARSNGRPAKRRKSK